MTDYLEQLLEQQEEQEEGAVPDWSRRILRIWEQQTQEQSAADEMTHRQEVRADNEMQILTQAVAEVAWQNRVEQMSLTGQLERLRRAVRQAREYGGRSAVVQPIVQSGMVDMQHGASLSVRRAADYAAAMDAAFQRDARRYDGPLGLL